jgi:hypothetical protein
MELAIACCREDPAARPSLAQVVERLDKLNQELKRLKRELENQTITKEGRDLFLSLCTGVRPPLFLARQHAVAVLLTLVTVCSRSRN